MTITKKEKENPELIAVDLFCGIGGLTHGFIKSGLKVNAGIDSDESCKYAYEKNNNASFIKGDIRNISLEQVRNLYPKNGIKVLAGCAPCQTFSQHTQKIKGRENDERWDLLYSFLRIVKGIKPEIVSMENVPGLARFKVFSDFIEGLKAIGYHVSWKVVHCPKYGIPQNRSRLVLLASTLGEISLLPETHDSSNYNTVSLAIGKLPSLGDGEVSDKDTLHRAWKLSPLNKKRIKQSRAGGTWHDWDPELLSPCHKKSSGKSYKSVYARMEWDKPSPTITTEFYSYGTGRFGHPGQNRALSLREGALLQTFPKEYEFFPPNEPITFRKIGTHIGNAVPVDLGRIIAKSIKTHVEFYKRYGK